MSRTTTLAVAACQYDVGFLQSWEEYEQKIETRIAAARAGGAEMLVFPEYFSMELASLLGEAVAGDLHASLKGMQKFLPGFLALFARLAKAHGVTIVAGSFPVADGARYVNRAHVVMPDGTTDYQDKLTMTRFEREQWGISGTTDIKLFEGPFGPFAISICYDVEFPLIARRQAEMGAQLILAPSCTEGMTGYHRVKIGAAARALENQIYVVQAPTIGACPWSPAIDANTGAAGIFTPVDAGFAEDGVLAMGQMNKPGWVHATLDFTKLAHSRADGQTFNFRDWREV